jgi:hypothetical protein
MRDKKRVWLWLIPNRDTIGGKLSKVKVFRYKPEVALGVPGG